MASIFSKKISRRVLRFLFWYSASAKVNWLMIRLAGLKNGRCGYYRKKWRVIQTLLYGDILRLSNQPQIARGPLQVARRILSTSLEADTGCRWLPLAPAPQDALLLIERQLLGLKPGHMPHTKAET